LAHVARGRRTAEVLLAVEGVEVFELSQNT
jgi:hypothetical protein